MLGIDSQDLWAWGTALAGPLVISAVIVYSGIRSWVRDRRDKDKQRRA